MASVFDRPTSVILCGDPGALLNWVAYGFASIHPGGYHWTDVRMAGQRIDDRDPLARLRIPDDRLSVIPPQELARNDGPANVAISAVVRSDETTRSARQLMDFLRLPAHVQRVVASRERGGRPLLLVLSNGHRLAALYPDEAVGPLIDAVVASGVSLLVTYPDEPQRGRLAFEHVWHLRGTEPSRWGEARFSVEKGTGDGPFRPGSVTALRDLPDAARILEPTRHLAD
jgi:hypothetical protein